MVARLGDATGAGMVCKAAAKWKTVAAGWKDAVDFTLRTRECARLVSGLLLSLTSASLLSFVHSFIQSMSGSQRN